MLVQKSSKLGQAGRQAGELRLSSASPTLALVCVACWVLQGEAEVARCVAEANVFALASHQYWGTWSLLQVRQAGGQAGRQAGTFRAPAVLDACRCAGSCSPAAATRMHAGISAS